MIRNLVRTAALTAVSIGVARLLASERARLEVVRLRGMLSTRVWRYPYSHGYVQGDLAGYARGVDDALDGRQAVSPVPVWELWAKAGRKSHVALWETDRPTDGRFLCGSRWDTSWGLVGTSFTLRDACLHCVRMMHATDAA